MHRRDFLELATLTSLGTLMGPAATAGASFPNGKLHLTHRPRHAALDALAVGSIEPQGWLRQYLQKQADGLGSHLPEVSWPFDGAYWSDNAAPHAEGGLWAWEQKGYWIDGAHRCGLALKDPRLIKTTSKAIDYTLKHVDSNGYLGPTFMKDVDIANPERSYAFRWPHAVFFRALAAHAEATDDARIPQVMAKHYLSDKGKIYGRPARNVINIESMLWAYARTGNEQLLELAKGAWEDYIQGAPAGERDSGDLNPDRVFADLPISAHGVTYIETAKLPAILYMHTGNEDYLRYALAAQQRIFDHHMLIDGIPSASEAYRGTNPLDAHETCDISDHMWTWGYLLMATGEGVWGDRIERACFNAGLGAIKKDWKAVQYFSSPNQVIATDDSSQVPYVEESKGWMAFRPNPGRGIACCGANVHRFLPNYAIRMWMSDAQGGLAATLYGASNVQTQVGGESIMIREQTDYPFGEEIHFTMEMKQPVEFGLSLRIPGWCKAPSLALNGSTLPLPAIQKGFVKLSRLFRPGDRITLKLPMVTKVSSWPDQGVGIEQGPLVYALPVKEEWTSHVEPKFSTAEYPEWNARPKSEWNYALWFGRPDPFFEIRRTAMTADPWIDPPISISIPATKVSGWTLQSDSAHPERLKTPPLPLIDNQHSKDLSYHTKVERVKLVPYGATHLRLTIFPRIVA